MVTVMDLKVHHFDQLSSTNTFAKESLDRFERDQMHLVIADMQTHGHGRKDRPWLSPKGNLFATYCLSLPIEYQYKLAPTTILLAICCCDYFAKQGVPLRIKWPNDLFLEGKKCGGLLGETHALKDHVWLILGLGLNLHLDPKFFDQIDQEATSLHLHADELYQPLELAKNLAPLFTTALHQYLQEGFAPFLSAWQKYNVLKEGDSLSLDTAEGIVKGTFLSLEQDGSIALTSEEGEVKKLISAEIL